MKAERQRKEATSRVMPPSKGGGGHIVDNRPEAIAQTKLSDLVSGSINGGNAVQRMVRVAPQPYESTEADILAEWDALDGDLDDAIPEAIAGVQGSGPYTPHQGQYLLNKTAANWGYCIEEKLDDKAKAAGWSTQAQLGGSRPDYYKEIDSTPVFADLTTDSESSAAGLHIWEKLRKGKKTDAASVGADITYIQTGPTTSAVYVPTPQKQAAHLLNLFKRVDYDEAEDTDKVKARLDKCAKGEPGNYSAALRRGLEILSTSSEDNDMSDSSEDEDMSD